GLLNARKLNKGIVRAWHRPSSLPRSPGARPSAATGRKPGHDLFPDACAARIAGTHLHTAPAFINMYCLPALVFIEMEAQRLKFIAIQAKPEVFLTCIIERSVLDWPHRVQIITLFDNELLVQAYPVGDHLLAAPPSRKLPLLEVFYRLIPVMAQ
ncbi:hypothetical protein, partial [Bradyrhizobium cosmicum]|uniref:hypothetical protein n=1 Tax=Bradyrhizobium cosmicum TaxID=1404864 RepID=UPI0028F02C74